MPVPLPNPVPNPPPSALPPNVIPLHPRGGPNLVPLEPAAPAIPAAAAVPAVAEAGGLGLGLQIGIALPLTAALVLGFDAPAGDPKEDLLFPPEPIVDVDLPPSPFQGGQEPKVLYDVSLKWIKSGGIGAPDYAETATVRLYGPIVGVKIYYYEDGNTVYTLKSGGPENQGPFNLPREQYFTNGYHIQHPNIQITNIKRVDNQPDTAGNPPPLTPPIYSNPGIPLGTPQPQAPTAAPAPALGQPQGQPLPQLQIQLPPPAAAPTSQLLPQLQPIGQPQPIPIDQFSPLPFNEFAPGRGLNLVPPPYAEPTPPPAPTANPTLNKLPAPTILIQPGANPGPLTFTPNPTTGNPTPTPTTTPTPTPERSPDPQRPPLEEINKILGPIGIGIAGLTALLKPVPGQLEEIKDRTSPQALQDASKAATCDTMQPGGCSSNAINKATGSLFDRLMQGLGAGADLNSLALLKPIKESVELVNTKLGPQLPNGGISGLLSSFFSSFNNLASWMHLDRILNILTFTNSLHNAYMLSNGLEQTLFSMVSNVLATVGIKDKDGSALDINGIVGRTVDNLFKSVLGTQTVNGIKQDWAKLNRIYQAGANVIGSFQSIANSFQSGIDAIGSQTGKIGNALKRFGVVGERAFGWMSENFNTRTSWLDRLENSINSVQQVTSNIDTVASEVLSVQDTVKQLREQQKEFETALKTVEPKPTTDNKPVQDKNAADKKQAQSSAIAIADLEKPD